MKVLSFQSISKVRPYFFKFGYYFHRPAVPLKGGTPESASIPEPVVTMIEWFFYNAPTALRMAAIACEGF
jgi:hypothetical protein